ncbi:LysR family transcriptional regulator [Acidovorax sp. MR-S7]|uniref:LysR family transcriptional regulator n=1 Tax=Acidovorax sp. MR-S7 TaxID=1268622 RepID=UPI00037B7334|nr:LysR family transcriptional regulator [Acidovorax sp. MR-S7]GAD22697.1 transcriptional regulator [Acidovorax sp. MR-S7]
MKVTLRQIEGFLAVADTLSFSRGAQKLHVTQSAFSQLIREMETALDVRLFDRTTRKVVLTEAGRALLLKMRSGLMAIEEACLDAQAISRLEKGHASVGALPSLASGYVAQALGDLRRLHPGVSVSLHEAQNPDLLEMVLQGQVELAVCAQVPASRELVFEGLFAEELVALVPADHPLAGKARQTWKKLARVPLILMSHHSSTRRTIAEALLESGLPDKPAHEVASLHTAVGMVRAGMGAAIMPLTALMEVNLDGLATCRLSSPVPLRRIAICRRRDRVASAAALEVSHLVRVRVQQSLRQGILPSPVEK